MTLSRDILLIKLGALGDVLRTTPLLRRLGGRVTWVTEREALPLLAGNPRIRRLEAISSAAAAVSRRRFSLVLNLDEDDRACRLAEAARGDRKVGLLLRGGIKTYDAASAPWFDMSLVSRLGRSAADELKCRRRLCYQDYVFRACGLRFQQEDYISPIAPRPASRRLIAFEPRVGERWPAKSWPGFARLAEVLSAEGFEVRWLRRRRRLLDYFEDINRCGLMVCSDTLAMHAGLALRKGVVSIFTCTNPYEIFGYGRMIRLASRGWARNLYGRDPRAEPGGGITVAAVAAAVRRLARARL